MGGTNTRIGFSSDSEDFDRIERFPTPQSIEEAHQIFSQYLGDISTEANPIIFGVAGTVDYSVNRITEATNIEWIKGMSAKEITGLSTDIKAYNDAELAGVAESYQPYALDYPRIAYITISTGVGGTIVANKKAAVARYSFEPGHIIINKLSSIDDPADHTQGSFENMCSGTAFFKRNKVKPENCLDKQIWERYGENLASGLYTITLLWQPDIIVLGGSMTNQWDYFYKSCAQRFDSYPNYYIKPDIIRSELKDTNGLLGGLKV